MASLTNECPFDEETKQIKQNVIVQLKQSTHYSGYVYSIIQYSHFNTISGVCYDYAFCKCGNYIKFVSSSNPSKNAKCYCI